MTEEPLGLIVSSSAEAFKNRSKESENEVWSESTYVVWSTFLLRKPKSCEEKVVQQTLDTAIGRFYTLFLV